MRKGTEPDSPRDNQARQTSAMPRYRATNPQPEKPDGAGWLYSEQQQRLCHFKPSMATVHAEWVEVRTFHLMPPRQPVRITQRRMLRHNAIEA